MTLLLDPQAWLALLTLTILEIILGIDNIVVISILSGHLPAPRQPLARRLGLSLALITRLLLLLSLSWLAGLTTPLVHLFQLGISFRDLVLIGGGLFLLAKGTREIHHALEIREAEERRLTQVATLAGVITQIVLLDMIFSLDSVITAIGMAQKVEIMAAAIVIAVLVMLAGSGPISRFIHRHPSVKVLALSFLLLIGVTLIAEGFSLHIPKGYLYFAMGFSGLVESLNLAAGHRKRLSGVK
jgi:predicted tellurium resistance membrane protein TerC